jgi:transcriptional regulator with XRE-family HTH domain
MTLPERLKNMRGRLNKTQKGMASTLGIAPRTWQNYEEGVHEPSWKVLEGLAGLGVNVNWLLTGNGEMIKPVCLTESEAHKALKERLRQIGFGLGTRHQIAYSGLEWDTYRAYLFGDYLPTKEELEALCMVAGGWKFDTGTMASRDEEAEAEITKRIEEIAKLQKTKSRIDIELLKSIATEIEEALFKSAIKLDPAKKAELLALVYDFAAESEKNRAGIKEQVQRLLRLVG